MKYRQVNDKPPQQSRRTPQPILTVFLYSCSKRNVNFTYRCAATI